MRISAEGRAIRMGVYLTAVALLVAAFSPVRLTAAADNSDHALIHFLERFDNDIDIDNESSSSSSSSRWHKSDDERYSEGEAVVAHGALTLQTAGARYGYAVALHRPLPLEDGLAMQYELQLSGGLSCGGAYLKLLSGPRAPDPRALRPDTPFSVMFGPDKCGSTDRVHLILRHRNPASGTVQEKHLRNPPKVLVNTLRHVYTLQLNPANASYAILRDGVELRHGSLLTDFDPPFVPPREVDDPDDVKPTAWVDHPQMPDPDATKPTEWDDAVDGPWKAPLVANPAYVGPWRPRRVPNPEFFELRGGGAELLRGVAPVAGVAVEVWTMDAGLTFDNIALVHTASAAEALRETLWRPVFESQQRTQRVASGGALQQLLKALDAAWVWWEGAEREARLFLQAPTIAHFFVLFGYLSAPALAVMTPLYVAVAVYRFCFREERRQENMDEDSDGEEPPELVPMAGSKVAGPGGAVDSDEGERGWSEQLRRRTGRAAD